MHLFELQPPLGKSIRPQVIRISMHVHEDFKINVMELWRERCVHDDEDRAAVLFSTPTRIDFM